MGGEPGIGKSVLITAGLAAAPGRGCRVCLATAHEHSPIIPLRVLLDALGESAGDWLGPALAGRGSGRRTRDEVVAERGQQSGKAHRGRDPREGGGQQVQTAS